MDDKDKAGRIYKAWPGEGSDSSMDDKDLSAYLNISLHNKRGSDSSMDDKDNNVYFI